MNPSFARGVRLGMPYAAMTLLISVSFGVVARQAGFSVAQTIVCSALVFGASAQFASVAILAAGGGVVPALAAAAMMHSRFLAMGIALAPSLPGGPVRRMLAGQTAVDSGWVLAARGDGSYDRHLLFGCALPQYAGWVTGTVVGAWAGDVVGDLDAFGLDAVFPTFFLGLLVAEAADRRRRVAALLGGAIALALVPIAPPGMPVLAASIAALVGLAAPRRDGPGRATAPDGGGGDGRSAGGGDVGDDRSGDDRSGDDRSGDDRSDDEDAAGGGRARGATP